MPDEPQNTHEELYDVSIETLGLSKHGLFNAKRSGVTTVGDCLDIYAVMINPNSYPSWHPGILKAMPEIIEKLKAQSYLPPAAESWI